MERLSLGARFRGAVELHGCSTAAVEGGTKLDYTAVADRVQGFVDAYARAGLGREDTVAVAAVGSAAAWQAIVGAAVAGLTWIPVDARQPEPILRHILRNSGAGLCVGFALETESAAGAHCEYLDGTTVASTSWRGACARGHASSSDIAYVIYTSGSTGLPKGVLISEDALSGFLDWTAAHEGLARDDRILQNHSIGFDNSIWEMFSGLSAGGAVVFPTADERRDFELLLRLIERARVTVLNATPRQMTTLLRAGDLLGRQGSFATVRRLYTGAETVTHAAAELILRALPPTAYVANEYGPTEATITCTLGPITHKVLEASASEPSVPIGWAIGDATIEVRSGDRRCVELGDIGELWVGGRCVSLGYRGLPEETTERFAVDDDGTRWYRTGDVVRTTPYGYVFLGRADGQVKVRGNRIETAALESAVAALPGVVEAAAVPVGGVDGAHEALWLFVVGDVAAGWGRESLRTQLERSLPYTMVPDRIVMRNALPLTVNGKLDRRTLLADAGHRGDG